jgi:tetratricopeptide (TPR) repeat protein
MEGALSMYERLAASPRPPLEARRRAFETAVLLAVRAKELGIVADAWLTRARSLAQAVPSMPAPALPSSAYLEAAESFVGETSGLDPEERQARAQRLRSLKAPGGAAAAVRTLLEPALASDLVAQYLALALDCDGGRAGSQVKPEDALARHGAVPLLRYLLALCGSPSEPIGKLREEDPRWTDMLFFEGRRQLTLRPEPDVLKAAEHLSAARVAFPGSTAITMALGNAQNALSEYDAALAAFNSVLDDESTHRDALLGRVMSLSYLTRHPEAIASATKMIDLGTWHLGDAYYWRAWNRYSLKELDTAWDDIERAIRLQRNTSVYTLAGFIAWARQELDTAVDRFDLAFKMDRTNCEAIWSESLVHIDRQAWQSAAPKFSGAMSCFVASAAQARADIAAIEKATYAEALKVKRLAAAEKRVETAEHRKAQSAYNAANIYLRLGEKNPALNHADVAAEHPLLKEKALTLKATIEKIRR